mgnify:CR=1 FL=1
MEELEKVQAFPLHLYFQEDEIPRNIILGTDIETGRDACISEEDMNVHWYLLGKTGCGKSFFELLFSTNLLAMGKRIILIDPLGSLYRMLEVWTAYLAREYYLRGEKQFSWFRKDFLDKVLFMDLSKANHPYRSSLIHPIGQESVSDMTNRLIKFFDALFSTGTSGDNGMSLQLQRRQGLVTLIVIFAVTETPLEQARYFVYNKEFRAKLLQQAELKDSSAEVRDAIGYWEFFGESFKGSSYAKEVLSLLTGLAPFYESQIVRKFLLTNESNVDWQDIFDSKSLIIRLPINDLASRRILMNYFYSGTLFPLISNRDIQKNGDILYIESDESSVVFDEFYSETIALSRNKRVFFVSAHQARKQLLTEERIRIAETIEDQSDVCVYFRVGYEDALKVVEEKMSPDGKRLKHVEPSVSISKNLSESMSSGISQTVSRQNTMGHGKTAQESHTKSLGESVGMTVSQSLSETLNRQFARAESRGLTETFSLGKTFTMTYSKGLNIGRTSTDGFSLTYGLGSSSAEIKTKSGTVTLSENSGEGSSESSGNSHSTGQSSSKSQSIPTYSVNYQPLSGSASASKGVSSTISDALQTARGTSHSFSRGKAEAIGNSEGHSTGTSATESLAMSKQLGNAVSVLKNYAEGVAESFQKGKSYSSSLTDTEAVGSGFGSSLGLAFNQAKTLGDSIARSHGASMTESMGQGSAWSEQNSHSETVGESLSSSYHPVYYTVEEEARLLAQELRDLPPRQFILAIKNKKPQTVVTATCLNLPYKYGEFNFLEILRNYNRSLCFDKEFTLFPQNFPEKKLENIEIYRGLPEDFGHFLPSDV